MTASASSPAAPPASVGARGDVRSARRAESWLLAAFALGVVSLGLSWAPTLAPGYEEQVRVPVLAAGLLVALGWRRQSRVLLRLGVVSAVAALAIGGRDGAGPPVFLLALSALWLAVRARPEPSDVQPQPTAVVGPDAEPVDGGSTA